MDVVSDRRAGYLYWLVKKATETHLNKNNFNSEGDFMSSQAWSPTSSWLMNEKQDKAEHILDTPFVSWSAMSAVRTGIS
jgi:hypothetical protein